MDGRAADLNARFFAFELGSGEADRRLSNKRAQSDLQTNHSLLALRAEQQLLDPPKW